MAMASATKLKLFVDYMSQPARACIIFCRANGIDFEEHKIAIARKQQQSPAYEAVNPLRKIPCLVDGDFCLPESATILRYLATTQNCPSHWYPVEPQVRARVDAALDWSHGNIRGGEAKLVVHRVLNPLSGAAGPEDPILAAAGEDTLKQALKDMNNVWLAKSSFVAGEQISIADLLISCELSMLELLDGAKGPNMNELMEPHPAVRHWLDRVEETTAPHYEDVTSVMRKFAKRIKDAREKKEAAAQSKL